MALYLTLSALSLLISSKEEAPGAQLGMAQTMQG
jgi:hypothetical protein